MSTLSIVYILINYIFLMSITVYAILKKIAFSVYIENILIIFLFLNLSIIAFEVIVNTFKNVGKSNFEVSIQGNEEEIKDLLKQVSQEEKDEILSSIEDENIKNENKPFENDDEYLKEDEIFAES